MDNKKYNFKVEKTDMVNEPIPTWNQPVFTPAQVEVINAVAHLHSEEEIRGLKLAISNYFAQLVDKEMDRLWDEGEWNEQTLEELKTAHYRTPYNTTK